MSTRCCVHFVPGKGDPTIVSVHWGAAPDGMMPVLNDFIFDERHNDIPTLASDFVGRFSLNGVDVVDSDVSGVEWRYIIKRSEQPPYMPVVTSERVIGDTQMFGIAAWVAFLWEHYPDINSPHWSDDDTGEHALYTLVQSFDIYDTCNRPINPLPFATKTIEAARAVVDAQRTGTAADVVAALDALNPAIDSDPTIKRPSREQRMNMRVRKTTALKPVAR